MKKSVNLVFVGVALLCAFLAGGALTGFMIYVPQPPLPPSQPEQEQQHTPVCTETDSGRDFNVRGDVYIDGVWQAADFCSNNGVVQETPVGVGKLIEFYCTGSSYNTDYINIGSAQKCKFGALVSVVSECTDTDNGINYNIKGTTSGLKYNSAGEKLTLTDRCIDNSKVMEYYCGSTGSKFVIEKEYSCPSGQSCQDGACKVAQSSPPPALQCTETDNGMNPFVRGDIKINGVWKDADYCVDSKNNIVSETPIGSGKLMEFVCKGNSYERQARTFDPIQKCRNGALVACRMICE